VIKVKFGINTTLDGLSHLISLSEIVAGAKTSPNELMSFTVALLFVRLLQGRLDADASVRSNRKNILPVCVQGFRFVSHALRCYTYAKGSVEESMLDSLKNPYDWFTATDQTKTKREANLIAMTSSAKNLYNLIAQGLYLAESESVFLEAEANLGKKSEERQVFFYTKFNAEVLVENLYRKEVQQAGEHLFRIAAGVKEAASTTENGDKPVDDDVDVVQAMEAEESEEDIKHRKLLAGREAHAKMIYRDHVTLLQRPATREDFTNSLGNSPLVIARHSFALDWKHGWVFDAGADRNTIVSDASNKSAANCPPPPDIPIAKLFFDTAVGIAEATAESRDICLLPSCKSKSAVQSYQPLLIKMKETEDLQIVYKQSAGKQRDSLQETVLGRTFKNLKFESTPRLYYQLTTTGADCMLQVALIDTKTNEITKAVKQSIVGEIGLQPKERIMTDTDLTQLFYFEKTVETWEEIFHHFELTSGTFCTLGGGNIVIAALKRDMKILGLARNSAHLEFVNGRVLKFLFDASQKKDSPYFLSRDDLLDRLGYEREEKAAVAIEKKKGQLVNKTSEATNVSDEQDKGVVEDEDEEEEEEEEEEEYFGEEDDVAADLGSLFVEPKKKKAKLTTGATGETEKPKKAAAKTKAAVAAKAKAKAKASAKAAAKAAAKALATLEA
jgi:hypothetical protein